MSGSLTLAGDLLLIMLDDATGRLRVRPRVAGYGLAGALLIELWWAGLVAVDARRIRVLNRRPPDDPLLRRLLGSMMTEPERTGIGGWVEYLATGAVEDVAGRLVETGWIRVEQRLGLSGRHPVFVPVDRSAVFWRAGRLAGQAGRVPTWVDLALYGLLDAVGVASQTVGCLAASGAGHRLAAGPGRLPAQPPPVVAVCGQVQALVARAAISLR
ncbi:MAG: GPP34 family phosphoprotein [Dactylosporangium sp.]|nr:GPP34 family phosphoprotein [Dactylosporangium sp.]NNJ59907.1 GPP34 family phosphoprotein [Dactylosporangium sp.]